MAMCKCLLHTHTHTHKRRTPLGLYANTVDWFRWYNTATPATWNRLCSVVNGAITNYATTWTYTSGNTKGICDALCSNVFTGMPYVCQYGMQIVVVLLTITTFPLDDPQRRMVSRYRNVRLNTKFLIASYPISGAGCMAKCM
jgi:hypothetical protein